jgi:hypothetical protein
MITCHLRYIIDPHKLPEFEAYARLWIPLVNRFGGTHHDVVSSHLSQRHATLRPR